MKPLILIFTLVCSGIFANAQNIIYDENAEVRSVENFTGIEVSGTVSLYLSQGNIEGVAVSAGDEKFNNKIKTEVKNGVLQISVDGGMWNGFNWSNRKLKAYVTVKTLNRLEASGASYISLTGSIKANELKLEVSGASEMKGDILADHLAIDVSGASVVKLSGQAAMARLEVSGAGSVKSYDLIVDSCNATSSGAAGIRIFVKDVLQASASGGSFIYYKGNPSKTDVNSSGGSSIKMKTNDD